MTAHLRRLRTLALVSLGAIALGGCTVPTFGAFRGATTQAHDEFKLYVGFAIAGLVVAVLVWGLMFWAIARYRRKGDEIPRQFHEHIPLEIVYTVIPVVIIGVLFYFTVLTENNIDATPKPTEIVHVVAYRWGWNFSYSNASDVSQGVVIKTAAQPTLLAQPATSKQYPQLVLPEGEATQIVLVGADVIHGFYIPAFNFSRYALPGVVNRFNFNPTTTGVFRGQCNQYCGLYHSEMLFSVRVVSPAAFTKWLSAQQASQAQSGGAA